ncbi:MAG: hypothetical protein AB1689_04905 [Thermodesulfobacteriota bacterium]
MSVAAHRGEAPCLVSDFCYFAVTKASAPDVQRFLDEDPALGAM